MATVRCPFCGEDIVPFPLEPGEEAPAQYVCPVCRRRLTIGVVDEYLEREEEEAFGGLPVQALGAALDGRGPGARAPAPRENGM